jgi:hypothetical protein
VKAFKKSFFEYDSVPANPDPYTVYFIEENGNAEIYVTNRFGHAKKVGNREMIQDVVIAMNITGGTGRPFRETYKDQILLNK